MRSVPRRRAVVWCTDRQTVALFTLLTLGVTALSLTAGLLIRGVGGLKATDGAVGLMHVAPPVPAAAAPAPEAAPEAVPEVAMGSAAGIVPETPARAESAAQGGSRVGRMIEQPSEPMGSSEVMAMPSPAAGQRAHDPAPTHDAAAPATKLVPRGPMFDGRPLRKVKQMTMVVTAYSPDARSCGLSADGITASGYSVWTNGMKMVAADTRLLPFGTVVSIPGYNGGRPVPVLDRGGAIKGNRLDVLYPTHEIALQWGVKRLTVTVWEYADQ